MATLADRLMGIKQRLEQAKVEVARTEGRLAQLERQRVEEFGCQTDDEAVEYIKELETEIRSLEQEIAAGLAAIEEIL